MSGVPTLYGVDDHEARYRAVIRVNASPTSWDDLREAIAKCMNLARTLGIHSGTPNDGDCLCGQSILWGASRRLVQPSRQAWGAGRPAELKIPFVKRDPEFHAYHEQGSYERQERDVLFLVEADRSTDIEQIKECIVGSPSFRDAIIDHGEPFVAGRNQFGHREGLSNLQDIRSHDVRDYIRHLYADSPIQGTYYVLRKYRVNPDKFPAPGCELVYKSSRNGRERIFSGGSQVLGREAETGLVVDRETGHLLKPQFDERQASRAHAGSHIAMANPRTQGETSFGDKVVVPARRIVRRSFQADDNVIMFQCFQASIEQGFELIHNEWLMSDFNGHPDPLLDPDTGMVEPLDTGYFFCPREQDPWKL